MIDSKYGRKLTADAEAAFREASIVVIQRARQFGTPVIVWKDGRVTELTPDEAEQMLKEAIAKAEAAQ